MADILDSFRLEPDSTGESLLTRYAKSVDWHYRYDKGEPTLTEVLIRVVPRELQAQVLVVYRQWYEGRL